VISLSLGVRISVKQIGQVNNSLLERELLRGSLEYGNGKSFSDLAGDVSVEEVVVVELNGSPNNLEDRAAELFGGDVDV
jgi:hypothetical protein